jgi:ABC-type dipeptide/oligopeptide/nickel transport system permease subunit
LAEIPVNPELRSPVRLVQRYPRVFCFGLIIVLLLGASLLAPVLAPYDPRAVNVDERLAGPSTRHLMGTDQLGRDTFSRVLYGGRTAIPLGLTAVTIAAVLGVSLGIAAGYFGGFADQATGRLVDAQLAFPELILALAIVNAFGASLLNVMVVIGFASYPGYYRLTRGQVLQARETEYIIAARSLGASERRIMLRHILPNVMGPLLIAFSLAAGGAVLLQSTLGFFGLGPEAGTPDWGMMFFDALANFRLQPWLILGPGLAVSLTVLCFYTLGDALRDALDPALRGRH